MRGRYALAMTVLIAVVALVLVSCGGDSAGEVEKQDESVAEAAKDNEFSFLVCGDPHARTDLLTQIIAQAHEGEFLVIVGDLTTGKGLEEMQAMKDFLDASGIEYYVIPGDNDMPNGDTSIFQAVFGPDHYAVDKQHSHLVFVNDAILGVGCPDEQLTWLADDLAALEGGEVIIAFAHVPPGAPVDIGNSGFVESESESTHTMLDILREVGTQVLYCGHLHAYMIYSYGPPRVVVTGGAGANLHLSEEAGGYHHFLRVTVSGDEVSEEVIRL